MEAPYLRITPGHYANIGEKDTLFKDRERSKTIPYSAARTYRAHIGSNPPGFHLWVTQLSNATE